jgi:Flp pilus assembly protein TadG
MKNQKGVAAVEFAIVLILLVPLVFGITEFGRAIYQYNTLTKIVRNGARYLTTQEPINGSYSCDKSTAEVCSRMLYDQHNKLIVSDLDDSSISYSSSTTGSAPFMSVVKVTISGYQFKSSLISLVIPGNNQGYITFGDISVSMRQAL